MPDLCHAPQFFTKQRIVPHREILGDLARFVKGESCSEGARGVFFPVRKEPGARIGASRG
jgi:hypothetical protein